MIYFVFGLPGAGKSTLVKSANGQIVRLDLGHNAFKSEAARTKFYEKLKRFTSDWLNLDSTKAGDIFIDSYPEYFDLPQIQKAMSKGLKLKVTFLLPYNEDGMDTLIERVKRRDGAESEFAKLYSKQGRKWWHDWSNIVQEWTKSLGKRSVQVLDATEWHNVTQLG